MFTHNKQVMENDPLTNAEKKELRGIGQRLKPHLHIGKQGLSTNVFKEIDRALIKNGLIKIRFEAEREAIQSYCNNIPEKLNCEYVGQVGKTGIFFRDMPEKA
jgi:RNA-binding protein